MLGGKIDKEKMDAILLVTILICDFYIIKTVIC
jgi:hypothetical protein